MYRYEAFGLSIASELELPGLPPARSRPDVTICLGALDLSTNRSSLSREFASNAAIGNFLVSDGRSIVVDPVPEGDPANLRSMLMGRVMGYLMRQRGWLPLHAGAALIRGRAAVFMGESGMGKSTTVAAFYAAGHGSLSDELCAVRLQETGAELCVAGTPIRLTLNSLGALSELPPPLGRHGDKYSVDLVGNPSLRSVPLAGIYILDYGPELRSNRIPLPDAVSLLSLNAFINVRGMDANATAAHFRSCVGVAKRVPIFRLFRERSLDRIQRVVSFIEEECARSSPGG